MRKRQLEAQQRLLDRAFIAVAEDAIAYTAKWHASYDWAEGLILGATGEVGPWGDRDSDRVEKLRGQVVRDLEDDDQAWRHKRPIADLEDWLAVLPVNQDTGRRRTVIRIFTWVIDEISDVVYDPEWVKIGDDMSPRRAQAHARRWARQYTERLDEGFASKHIIMTAIEIAFWTSAPQSKTV